MLPVLAVFLLVVSLNAQEFQPPSYLQGAPKEKQKEYQALIESSLHLTEPELDKKIEDWVNKQDASIKAAYAKVVAEESAAANAGKVEHDKAAAKLSNAAKEAEKKLFEMSQSKSLSIKKKEEEIEKYMDSLPKNIRDEIEKVMFGQ